MTNPDPGVLAWQEVPDPVPAPGEVVVDVVASAVNRADLLQVAGHYPPPAGASPIPGLEVSGLVDGRAVCALLAGGGYAQKVAVLKNHLMPVPQGVELVAAAALPEVACTVWSNLTMVAALQPGETVLIHGGGSGIGTFAIQYAKAIGAKVITTARASKHEALRELGADRCIDYTTEDFNDARADVILDIMGASYLERNIKALNQDGRLVIIGLQGGRKAEIDLGAMLPKRATIAATTLRARSDHDKSKIILGVCREVWPLIESGAIRPVVDRTMPMTQAAAAHQVVADSDHIGKVVLTIA